MSDPKVYIGRVAQLSNLVAKPELNGSYVVVESFVSKKERFGVRTLLAPNAATDAALSILVKLTNLQFFGDETFANRFPAAKVVQASILYNKIISGTILDFSNSEPAHVLLMKRYMLLFNVSCRCFGIPSALNAAGLASPRTTIQNSVRIDVKEEDGIVEFEDINFDCFVEPDAGLRIVQAKNIAFRRCRFHGTAFGVEVGLKQEPCTAIFENCLFEDNSVGDLMVHSSAHVTLFNCVLRSACFGVDVEEGGRFKAIHCSFHGQVRALEKVPSFELFNCIMDGATGNGIHLSNGTTGRLQGCRVMRCTGEGIVIKGPKRTTVHVEDCVVTECNMGFLLSMGKVRATLLHLDGFNNAYHGLHLSHCLTGSVQMNNCRFWNNHGVMDVAKTCGPECAVTIDNVLQPRELDVENFKRVHVDLKRLAAADFAKNGPCRTSLQLRRSIKLAKFGGPVVDLCCSNCLKVEPMGVKFKACAKCAEVVYCSRECQVAHWKQHKIECGKVEYG